jgi:dTDP-4-amino-4,6-dideoxygalactose transaminase
MDPIPLVDLKVTFEPLKEQIFKAWEEALNGMRLFLGPNVQAFEQEFAAYCGTKHAIGVADGTNAVHLALRACGIGPGDEVITVSYTFIATTEAIMLAGATPVFVDIDPVTYNMDVSQIESRITPRTRAILPVHLYGQCADMDPIMEIAARHNLYVIEDACQAHGAEYKGRKAGNLGHIAAFSFYFTKNLGAYGEGGIVTTNDDALAKKVRMLRDHGSEKRYYHEFLGWNARLDELQAAVLRIKMPHLDEWNEGRRQAAQLYTRLLEPLGFVLPAEAPYNHHVYHLYVIRCPYRDALRQYLTDNNIGTGVHYPVPNHLQNSFKEFGYGPGTLPVTESVSHEILSLPMYAGITPAQVERVAGLIHAFAKEMAAAPQ